MVAALAQVLVAVQALEVAAEAGLVLVLAPAKTRTRKTLTTRAEAPAPVEATRTLNKASDSDPKGWFGTDAYHSRLYESARQKA